MSAGGEKCGEVEQRTQTLRSSWLWVGNDIRTVRSLCTAQQANCRKSGSPGAGAALSLRATPPWDRPAALAAWARKMRGPRPRGQGCSRDSVIRVQRKAAFRAARDAARRGGPEQNRDRSPVAVWSRLELFDQIRCLSYEQVAVDRPAVCPLVCPLFAVELPHPTGRMSADRRLCPVVFRHDAGLPIRLETRTRHSRITAGNPS